MNARTIISPEVVAHRIFAARESGAFIEELIEQPRIIEALWFVQGMSIEPLGLEKLAARIMEMFPHNLGTPQMRKWWHQEKLSKIQTVEFWNENPRIHREHGYIMLEADPEGYSWVLEAYKPSEDEDRQAWEQAVNEQPNIPELIVSEIRERYTPVIQNDIVFILRNFCENKGESFKIKCRTFDKLFECLLTLMDRHVDEVASQIASTTVTKMVCDALDYALEERVMVRIEGDPRFGKTESVAAWCRAHPGRARLVTVPCSNKEKDLYEAVAEALGFTLSFECEPYELKGRLEFILTHARLMLVLDEAHFLIPQRYSANTPPMRLNWVRTRLVDRKVPCALVITPQTYASAANAFVKKTKHRFDQFFGRTAAIFKLPSDLTLEDLMAVAKIHFPEIDRDYLELIAGKAMASESYLQAMEHIAKRARFLARRDGRESIDENDIEAACEIVPQRETAKPLQQPRKRPAPVTPVPAPARAPEPIRSDADAPINRISKQRQNGSNLLREAESLTI